MCYHNSITKDKAVIESRFKAYFEDAEEYNPIYHSSGFSHPKWPIILAEEPTRIKMFQWGLVPAWVKDSKQADEIRIQTLNARGEEVFDKPSYRNSIKAKRCLVISDGFYEWMDCNKKKYPHFIGLKDGQPFAMAGIYETWQDKSTGEVRNTFSVLTCEANPLMARIHNVKQRMPVILPPEIERGWLDPNLKKEEVLEYVKPYEESLMDAYTISKLITSRTENPNQPAIRMKFNYPELAIQGGLF